jgi:hypothetical protein
VPSPAAAVTSPPVADRSSEKFSPVALRFLRARRSAARRGEPTEIPVQRHRVILSDDRIDVALADIPGVGHDGRPSSDDPWLDPAPYLVWTPLPYDSPENGIAFVCLGAGDEGCLFIDLAAAPGAIAIGGDTSATDRLTESIAHQLCPAAAVGPDPRYLVAIVGDAVPEPHPPGAASAAGITDLAAATAGSPADVTEIVFCRLRANEDALALARYASGAERRVVPVVLADLPEAPWSFTAQPRHPAPG